MASRLRTTSPALLLDALHFVANTRPSMSRTCTDNPALLKLWPSSRWSEVARLSQGWKVSAVRADDLDEWALARLSPKVRSSSEFRAPEERPKEKLSSQKIDRSCAAEAQDREAYGTSKAPYLRVRSQLRKHRPFQRKGGRHDTHRTGRNLAANSQRRARGWAQTAKSPGLWGSELCLVAVPVWSAPLEGRGAKNPAY